jgi:hypothetical protein
VRARGIAFELDSRFPTVAAPVQQHDGTTLAALGLTVTPEAWQSKGAILTKAVVGTAARLSDCIRERRQYAAPASTGFGLPASPVLEPVGAAG